MSDPRAEIALRTATTHTRPARRRAFSIRLGVCLLALVAYPTGVHADDVQLWTVGRVDHRLTDTWAGQLLVRFRFDEDISQAKDFMLRTYSHWELGKFDAGFGYDYLYSFPRVRRGRVGGDLLRMARRRRRVRANRHFRAFTKRPARRRLGCAEFASGRPRRARSRGSMSYWG